MIAQLLLPGMTPRAPLDKLQARIEAVLAEEEKLRKMPPSEAKRRAAIRDDIARAANHELTLSFVTGVPETAHANVARLCTLMLRAFEKVDPGLVEQLFLDDYIGSHKVPFGPPAEEKAAKLAALRAQREPLERKEEELIIDLERQGWFVIRRKSFDPKLVLKVREEHFGPLTPSGAA